MYHLQEAMGTSDFPLLFGDLLNRQMLGNYVPYPVTYPAYFKIRELNDFRTLNMVTLDGGQDILPIVHEHEPYKETAFTEGTYALSVNKYGRRYGISFEMVINDDMNALNERPSLMAVGARRSEEYLATTMMCDINGPHATFFSLAHGNLTTGALSITTLQTALGMLGSMVDSEGQPVMMNMVHLVTTPQNEIVAKNILNATELRINTTTAGGDTNQQLIAANWMKNRMTLDINPYINYVASACATEPWFLIAESGVGRPAFFFGFLRGRRTPQLFVKDPDARLLGGGDVSPLEGNFDNDMIDYKIRHIFGAAQGDYHAAVASFG